MSFPVTTGDLISAADWNGLPDMVKSGFEQTGTNQALTTSFADYVSVAFSPPSDWNTYDVTLIGHAHLSMDASSDTAQMVAVIGGDSGTTLEETNESDHFMMVGHSATGLTTTSLNLKIRVSFASGGTGGTAKNGLLYFTAHRVT